MSPGAWVVLVIIVLALLAQLLPPWMKKRRRRRLLHTPLKPEFIALANRRIGVFARVPPELVPRLHGLVNVFLDEKTFVGCNGQRLDDEIRVTIAAQACLLLLGEEDGCFDDLRTILVYPQAFYVLREWEEEHGVVSSERQLLLGESWEDGQVVVSWHDARHGGVHGADGENVVLHEFAHQLDAQSGSVNGAPPLPAGVDRAGWARDMSGEYEALVARVEAGRGDVEVLDPYAATNPEEFFAVATELFFEQPELMAGSYPVLYRCLAACYRLDPAAWPSLGTFGAAGASKRIAQAPPAKGM